MLDGAEAIFILNLRYSCISSAADCNRGDAGVVDHSRGDAGELSISVSNIDKIIYHFESQQQRSQRTFLEIFWLTLLLSRIHCVSTGVVA